jgi:hypothetical protein
MFVVQPSANVEGNARITGTLGAVIFVLLIVEGVTIPRVSSLITLHVFVGMVLVAFVAAKIGSTTFRFARYYTGRREYVDKGPPPFILRALGPIVTVLTVAVLASGIGLVLQPHGSRVLLFAHKASFVLWFCVMTVHVLGHLFETPALAFADWRRSRRDHAAGAMARVGLVVVFLVIGVAIASASLGWAHNWQHIHNAGPALRKYGP